MSATNHGLDRKLRSLASFLHAQRHRRFLWGVVAFASGIGLYYALPHEPDWRALAACAAMLGLFALVARQPRRRACRWLLLPVLGAAWAAFHTAQLQPLPLARELTPRPVVGTVADIERVEKGLRFTLDDVAIRGVPPDQTPPRIRLSVRLKAGDAPALPQIGDRVEMLAGLLPPMGAAMPGGFDFARYFYFRNIGAVGYGLPPWKQLESRVEDGLAVRFMQWRQELTGSIIAALGPQRGPVAAGMVTGEARAIGEADFEALRASNLYHIIAISGGHMVVITGVIFVGLRLLLLLLPHGAGLRPGAKSVAAAITLVMVTLYLFVTGMPISAVRAYVMIVLVLLAVLLRRDVDPMRSLMLTALVMLLIDPSDFLEPGFRLSFVATLAIVALTERMFLRPAAVDAPWPRRALRIVAGMLLISFVAEGATALLVIQMFNNFSFYGVLANALATPLVALLLMPSVALFFLLLPFGAEGLALQLMDLGIRAMLWIAHTIAALPGAQSFLPSPPSWGTALGVAGLLFVCLIVGRARWWGLVAMALGAASIATVALPNLLVGNAGKQIAVRDAQGAFLLRGRPDSLVPELWANGLGYRSLPLRKSGGDGWHCDRIGCVLRVQDVTFAFPTTADAMEEDCQRANWVLSTLSMKGCKARRIHGYALKREGVQWFWIDEDGTVRHRSSADEQGQRPWSVTKPATPAWRR